MLQMFLEHTAVTEQQVILDSVEHIVCTRYRVTPGHFT